MVRAEERARAGPHRAHDYQGWGSVSLDLGEAPYSMASLERDRQFSFEVGEKGNPFLHAFLTKLKALPNSPFDEFIHSR